MKDINIGLFNLLISDKLNESYSNNDSNLSKIVSEYVDIVANSPILQLEMNTYNNLNEKVIESDLIASRYIDNNIRLFEMYCIDEVNTEHKKLTDLIEKYNININLSDKAELKLISSINNLIIETITDYDEVDVDVMHESFEYVLSHLKKPKNRSNLSIDKYINEDVIDLAINKFNDKYLSLNEQEKGLINELVGSTYDKKVDLFENYKTTIVKFLNDNRDTDSKDYIDKTIIKIESMDMDENSINENIISLYDLYDSLIETK